MTASPETVPVAVIIPTYDRGDAVLQTLDRVYACRPLPSEVWVHIDGDDDRLARLLARDYPSVHVLTSPVRLGSSGGRDRCLRNCTTRYAVTFDDDSYPVDPDFFAVASELLDRNPQAAIVNANIWHRHQPVRPRTERLTPCVIFTGCGHATRVSAYRSIRGYLPRPVGYGMEENDVALQLFGAGWTILESGQLRVFHDTELRHHDSAEIVGGTAANVALFAFLHYPVVLWTWGLLQLGNFIAYCLRAGRTKGLVGGLLRIPADCYHHRRYRHPVALSTVIRYLRLRRSAS